MKILIYDTETTGKIKSYKVNCKDGENWLGLVKNLKVGRLMSHSALESLQTHNQVQIDAMPRLVMLNWDVWAFDSVGNENTGGLIYCNEQLLNRHVNIIKPDGFIIPTEASNIHGITQEKAKAEGRLLIDVLREFKTDATECEYMGGHNIVNFDSNVVNAEFERLLWLRDQELDHVVNEEHRRMVRLHWQWLSRDNKPHLCIDTMLSSTSYCKLPGKFGYKWPKLQELYMKLFGKEFEGAHAEGDVQATAACLFELLKLGVVKL